MKIKPFFGCRWLNILTPVYGFRVGAITVYPFIFYKDKKPKRFVRKHELEHVRQVEKEGIIRFSLKYCLEYFNNRFKGMNSREAYRKISYERSARRKMNENS
jgi:hypothetical protein